eukprot:1668708-Prymnesium_polylepis.2
MFRSPPSDVAAYAFDSTAALALLLDAVEDLDDKAEVMRLLSGLAFEGASGLVHFNAATFDRDASSVLFTIYSVSADESCTSACAVNLRKSASLALDPASVHHNPLEPIVWFEGVTETPADLSVITKQCSPGYIRIQNPSG